MTDPPGPRADILNERLVNLGDRFGRVETIVSTLVTKEDLTSLIASRDLLMNTQIMHLTEEVRKVAESLATERAERIAANIKEETEREKEITELETRADRARNFSIASISLTLMFVFGIIALITQGGSPV